DAVGMRIAMVPQLVPVAKAVAPETINKRAGNQTGERTSPTVLTRNVPVPKASQEALSDHASTRITSGSRLPLMPAHAPFRSVLNGSFEKIKDEPSAATSPAAAA